MKARALSATALVALVAFPAAASAGTSIQKRLHRADVALNKAQDAADDGNDAGVASGLRGANRQTALALKAAQRLVARDRDGAYEALTDTTEQLGSNAQAAMDLLGGASNTVVDAVSATLVATDTGRGKVLTQIQGLGDLEPDWGDALTQIADEAVNELTTAADNYDGGELSSAGEDALTSFVSHDTDAAGAIVAEIAKLAAEADAELDGDALESLEADAEDAADALDAVTGLSSANASSVDDAVAKVGLLADAVTSLVDAIGGSHGDDEFYDDDDWYGDEDYDDGYRDGYVDAFIDWGWAPRGRGYRGWDDDGFRPGRGPGHGH